MVLLIQHCQKPIGKYLQQNGCLVDVLIMDCDNPNIEDGWFMCNQPQLSNRFDFIEESNKIAK